MTQQLNNIIVAFAVATLSMSAFAKTKEAAKTESNVGTYTLDAAHSKVGFEIPHLVISTVEGRFTKFDGDFEIAKKFTDSKVTANIDINSIDTANADRDKHLKSADFFDVEKYPKMTFKSKKITGSEKNFKIVGDLTIKDVTKEVTFDGKYLGNVADAFGNTKAAFTATTKINRQQFNLKWSKLAEAGPVVGDEVTISLKIQGTKAK
ncbi:MAG: YceI family protein [Pseudobdellovibrio sp.]